MKTSSKHIVVVASDFPAEGHPSYVFVEQLVNAFVDLDVKISVIAPQGISRNIIHCIKPLQKHSFAQSSKGNSYEVFRPYNLSVGNHFPIISRFLSSIRGMKIRLIAKKIKPDALYCHFWENALPVCKFASKTGIPLFVACGEGDDALETMVQRIDGRSKIELKKAVTGVVCVSSENRRKCLEYGLIDDERITVQPNCVDTDLFYRQDQSALRKDLGITDEDFVLAFVGGFTPRKGPDRVAQAIRKLNDQHIKSIFIGKPFLGYDFVFDCPGIVYRASADHSHLPGLLNCADIFVLPTLKEGCSNAIVEALACGLPVISSNGSFNDDILDDDNSIRIDPMDINALSNAILFLKENPATRRKMTNISVSRHEQYSIEGRAQRILGFIEKMTN